jgi:hypothetical protein
MNQYVYYVYAYLRRDGTPYYIGKGKGKRAFTENHNLNVPIDKSRIVFLEINLSDIGALALERRYIRWYGRKDLGTGILQNRTDGGEGAAGRKMSAESKLKISSKNKGKILGSHSAETNEKRRITMIGKNKGRILGPLSMDLKEKLSIIKLGKSQQIVECPYCNKQGGMQAMHRWHFDKCDNKI